MSCYPGPHDGIASGSLRFSSPAYVRASQEVRLQLECLRCGFLSTADIQGVKQVYASVVRATLRVLSTELHSEERRTPQVRATRIPDVIPRQLCIGRFGNHEG